MKKKGRRADGEGSVYEHTTRGWTYQLTLPSGKRICRYAGSRKEAYEKLAELRREVDAGMHTSRDAAQTLHAFAESWLASHQTSLRSKTILSYRAIIHNHFDEIGDLKLENLTAQAIQNQYTRKLQDLSATTVQHIHALLHMILDYAVRLGIIPRNYSDAVDAPGLHPEEFTPLTRPQVGILIAAIAGTRDEALIRLALVTGMRQAELLGLRWQDVNLATGRVTVATTLHRFNEAWQLEPTKNKSSKRTLPLPQTAIDALRMQATYQDEDRRMMGEAWLNTLDLVFTTEAGLPIHNSNLIARFRRIIRWAKLPPIRFHDLRHTFATLLIEEGVPVIHVSRLLGHSSVNTTQTTYAHVTKNIEDAAIPHIERLLEFNPGVPGPSGDT